jgi:hypothetical protein
VPHVFHRNGNPIRHFRHSWITTRLPAPRRAQPLAQGPERVIVRLCGWKTRSAFDRHRIVPEADLREGLGKLA